MSSREVTSGGDEVMSCMKDSTPSEDPVVAAFSDCTSGKRRQQDATPEKGEDQILEASFRRLCAPAYVF